MSSLWSYEETLMVTINFAFNSDISAK